MGLAVLSLAPPGCSARLKTLTRRHRHGSHCRLVWCALFNILTYKSVGSKWEKFHARLVFVVIRCKSFVLRVLPPGPAGAWTFDAFHRQGYNFQSDCFSPAGIAAAGPVVTVRRETESNCGLDHHDCWNDRRHLVRPSEKGLARLYDLAVIAGGSIAIALCAQVAVGGPVPITGQTFAVLLVAAMLGCRRAVLCVLTYLAEGLLGLPVFAQGGAGVNVFLGPRGGYLVGFLAVAYIVGSLAERGWDRRPATTVLAMALGEVGLYTCGLAWLFCLIHVLARPLGGRGMLAVGLYPFLAGDAVKIALGRHFPPAGWKMIRHFKLDKK